MRVRTFHLGSLSGKSWPMSGRLRAPSSTSPSLCATHPRVCCALRHCLGQRAMREADGGQRDMLCSHGLPSRVTASGAPMVVLHQPACLSRMCQSATARPGSQLLTLIAACSRARRHLDRDATDDERVALLEAVQVEAVTNAERQRRRRFRRRASHRRRLDHGRCFHCGRRRCLHDCGAAPRQTDHSL